MIWKCFLILWLIGAHWRFIWNVIRMNNFFKDSDRDIWKEKDTLIELIKAYMLFILIWPCDVWFWYLRPRKPLTARQWYRYKYGYLRNWRLESYLIKQEKESRK